MTALSVQSKPAEEISELAKLRSLAESLPDWHKAVIAWAEWESPTDEPWLSRFDDGRKALVSATEALEETLWDIIKTLDGPLWEVLDVHQGPRWVSGDYAYTHFCTSEASKLAAKSIKEIAEKALQSIDPLLGSAVYTCDHAELTRRLIPTIGSIEEVKTALDWMLRLEGGNFGSGGTAIISKVAHDTSKKADGALSQ